MRLFVGFAQLSAVALSLALWVAIFSAFGIDWAAALKPIRRV